MRRKPFPNITPIEYAKREQADIHRQASQSRSGGSGRSAWVIPAAVNHVKPSGSLASRHRACASCDGAVGTAPRDSDRWLDLSDRGLCDRDRCVSCDIRASGSTAREPGSTWPAPPRGGNSGYLWQAPCRPGRLSRPASGDRPRSGGRSPRGRARLPVSGRDARQPVAGSPGPRRPPPRRRVRRRPQGGRG